MQKTESEIRFMVPTEIKNLIKINAIMDEKTISRYMSDLVADHLKYGNISEKNKRK